jgi:hypothetical protein
MHQGVNVLGEEERKKVFIGNTVGINPFHFIVHLFFEKIIK